MSGGSARLQQELHSRSETRYSTASFKDAFTGKITLLPIKSGQVTVDIGAVSRRVLQLTLPPLQSLFDTLSSPMGEITVSQTYRYINNVTETVPLGVFVVTAQSMTYKQDGELSLTCPDRWYHISSNGFGAARTSIASNTGWAELKRLVEGAWPNAAFPFPGWASIAGKTNPDQSATTKVGPLVWTDGDRNAAITSLLKLNSVDCYFDANGLAVLQPIPIQTTNTQPVWTVNDGPSGTLKDANRLRDITSVHNVIVLSSSASDIILPIVEVANTHAYATDPLSSLGPLGRVTMPYSDNFRSTPQMTAAGKVLLNKQMSVQIALDVTSTPNPCLDGYDCIDVVLPKGDTGTARPAERHIIQSVIIPLMPDGEQDISVIATRTTADDSV